MSFVWLLLQYQTYLKALNTTQQTHAVFGELANYGSEPSIYTTSAG